MVIDHIFSADGLGWWWVVVVTWLSEVGDRLRDQMNGGVKEKKMGVTVPGGGPAIGGVDRRLWTVQVTCGFSEFRSPQSGVLAGLQVRIRYMS